MSNISEVGVINAARKGGRKKPAKKRRRKTAKKATRRRRSSVKVSKITKRRKQPLMILVNSPQKDAIKSLKDAGIIAAGAIGAAVAAAYAKEKIEAVSEYPWAPAAVMIGSGLAVGIAFGKGTNRQFVGKIAMGAMASGIALLARPLIEGKLPGFEEGMVAEMEATAGMGAYIRTGQPFADVSGIGAYIPEAPPLGHSMEPSFPLEGVGQYDTYGDGMTDDDMPYDYGM